MTEKFDLIDYEVWGNEEEGFEVNDLFYIERGLEFEEVTKESIFAMLKEVNYLKDHATLDMLDIELEEFSIYVSVRASARPLCEFRKVDL